MRLFCLLGRKPSSKFIVGSSYHNFSVPIDNRGGRRDWKRLYVYTADARHGHVTLSKVRESHNLATYTAKAALIALERVFVYCSRVARDLEVKRRKNQAPFLNRLVRGLPFGLVVFSWDLRVLRCIKDWEGQQWLQLEEYSRSWYLHL